MPIRKLAPLTYPFEQLHGRCAALAERIAYIYINTFVNTKPFSLKACLPTKKDNAVAQRLKQNDIPN